MCELSCLLTKPSACHCKQVQSHFNPYTGIADKIASSLHNAGSFACDTALPGSPNYWISDRTVSLLKSRRNIPVLTNYQKSSESERASQP
ncbi:hypothetical protein T265_02514 [Opisthorchis viverrini]|uniref:Uncharacterized protein n=1 Tax=Opisthorchis viverrini TaxID=6198 RepID=A0A075AI84_OPIVI|nr:hypothetical protein T265_02514 [Opisthorchis viverrini]KER31189.1 hypothetical protein T265_02514 [Opisthorchis viverrini]